MLADLFKFKVRWPGIFMEFIFTIRWNRYCDLVDFLHAFNICQVFLHTNIVFDDIFVSTDWEAISSLGEN